jgi:hypothetical protein
MKHQKYFCPMHPEETSDKPGNCPKCGMRLVGHGSSIRGHESRDDARDSYWPLIVIIGLITLGTVVLSLKDYINGNFQSEASMSYFMAGFFLTFSAFKFLDLKGFADGYSSYDLLAQKIYQYGFIYPFLELGLGLAYLLQINDWKLHLFTFILMGFSGLGVLNSMLKRRKFQCACLGTFLKVPLTKVTLIEDFGMAAMALLMLVT